MTRILLVDGHNIIFQWGDLRKLHQRKEQRYLAREELLRRMRLLQDMSHQRVVVVFDGTGKQITEQHAPDDVQVFYSDRGHTADGVIERLAVKYSALYELRVCTADRMIWMNALTSGAQWVSPDHLRQEVEAMEQAMAKKFQR